MDPMDRGNRSEFSRYTPDELRELYKTDPERFEELAAAALDQACVGRTPEQTIKFRQMQWTVDAQLRKGRTSSERMHIMENIFYSKVFGEDGELSHLMDSCTDLIRAAGGSNRQPPPQKPTLRLVKR